MRGVVAAAILAAGIMSASLVQAEEIGRAGEAVVARVARPGGDRYEITVTPPPNRGVDRRVMEWVTDTGAASASDDAADDPVDVSDYHIRVEKTVSASCNGNYQIKSKPVNLAANKAWIVESATASSMAVAAFPTKGDVDIRVFVGTNGDVCGSSTRKNQNMDYVGCTLKMCELLAGFTNLKGEVGNFTTAQATAVAVFDIGFVDLP